MSKFCRGVRTTPGGCGCTGFVEASKKQGFFTVCAVCGDCKQTHYTDMLDTSDAPVGTATNSDVVESEKIAVAADRVVRIYSSATDEKEYTPKEMRKVLLDNNVEGVGERGRLRPEHIVKAKELLST